MSDWQERITHETPPAIRAEHEVRYRLAAPLIGSAAVWVDLGCGNGVAATAALGDLRPARAVLVDLDDAAVQRARGTLGLDEATTLTGDLTDPSLLDEVGASLIGTEGSSVITCFEVIEHLESFLPLLNWSIELAREHGATFVLSVPNDAFWAIQNPYHRTSWGEGAFEELRRLLPAESTFMRQVALTGSTLLDWEARPVSTEVTLRAGGPGTVTTHFLAAFGPRHADLAPSARVVQADVVSQRRWERERESNLAVAEQTLAEQREQLHAYIMQFDEWRAYIHKLERELGRPPSGQQEQDQSQPSTTTSATKDQEPEA